jgi:exodeoxyribonuclease VII large subunit
MVVPDKSELLKRLHRLSAVAHRALSRNQASARQHLALVSRRLPDMRRGLIDLRLTVDERAERLSRRLRRQLARQEQDLRLAASRLLLLSPRRVVAGCRSRVEQNAQMLASCFCKLRQTRRRHLEYCETHLAQLSPLAILKRGYAVATLLPAGTVIREAAQAPAGSSIRVRLAQGRLDCEVRKSEQ